MRFLSVSLVLVLVAVISTEGFSVPFLGGSHGKKQEAPKEKQKDVIASSDGKSSCLKIKVLLCWFTWYQESGNGAIFPSR